MDEECLIELKSMEEETSTMVERQKKAEECLTELKSMEEETWMMVECQKMAEEWLIELKPMEDETSAMLECQWKKRSIYKVPPHMTDLNKNAYRPQVVSFGPYHHGEEHLMPMEEHKQRALCHFLKRTKMPFEIIVYSLTKVVQDLKDSYDLLGDVWQSNTEKFLRLMVLDGCFMLEVLCYYHDFGHSGNYAINDPIFSTHGILHVMRYIRRDMLLLENQLPMRVLIELAAAMKGEDTEKGEAQEFLDGLMYLFTKNFRPGTGECLHLLDLFRKGMLWSSPEGQKENPTIICDDRKIIASAMELQEAGISFEAIGTGDEIGRIDEISFKNRVLRLPVFVVDDTTESMFLTVIAFERLHVGARNEVTSYIFFMGAIINSVRDAILLKSNGIVENAIGREEAIIELFKSLCKGTTLEPDSKLGEVHTQISKYRRKRWVKYREKFVHAYHVSTQWSPLAHCSIIFAILLFTLSLVHISK